MLNEIDGPLTALQRTDLTSIHRSGQHLLGLINNVLDLSKIEAGQMELNLESVDLTEKIQSAVATAQGLRQDKSLTLRAFLSKQVLFVWADSLRVQQILLNLLSNAVKFTEAGKITVTASHNCDWVTVSVADTGVGIPPEKHSDIFRDFTQVDSSRTRRFEGAGLGLSITKKLVELHGGRIWVESRPGHGSTFSFTLPAKQPGSNSAQLPVQTPLQVSVY
jgi:signal transduction histidine kinase